MLKARITITMPDADPVQHEVAAGDDVEVTEAFAIHINRVRPAAVTMLTSDNQPIALGIDDVEEFTNGGEITLTGVITV